MLVSGISAGHMVVEEVGSDASPVSAAGGCGHQKGHRFTLGAVNGVQDKWRRWPWSPASHRGRRTGQSDGECDGDGGVRAVPGRSSRGWSRCWPVRRPGG